MQNFSGSLFVCFFFKFCLWLRGFFPYSHRCGSLKWRLDSSGWWRLFVVSFNNMMGITWSGAWQSVSKDALLSVMCANCDGEACRSTASHVDQLHSKGNLYVTQPERYFSWNHWYYFATAVVSLHENDAEYCCIYWSILLYTQTGLYELATTLLLQRGRREIG